MKIPDFPSDENERLEDLKSLDVLDTAPEEKFDRLTRMAKRMFDVPIALVSLVDENRQWFKSCIGVDVNETPRDISFCGHAILGDEIFLIEDASKDERFFDNPLVTDGPKIRFYAGCPLKLPNKRKMGTLCIIDSKPRHFDDEDLEILRDLAVMVENELAALHVATIDELTKISNRRGFAMLCEKSLAYVGRHNIETCLAYFDLDNFKPINDEYGHREGDNALCAFSNLLLEHIRESDIFGRLGGDEFSVLFTGATLEDIETVLEAFEEKVDEYNKVSEKPYDIEFSYGVVEYDAGIHENLKQLLELADKKMYENKEKKKIFRSLDF